MSHFKQNEIKLKLTQEKCMIEVTHTWTHVHMHTVVAVVPAIACRLTSMPEQLPLRPGYNDRLSEQ